MKKQKNFHQEAEHFIQVLDTEIKKKNTKRK